MFSATCNMHVSIIDCLCVEEIVRVDVLGWGWFDLSVLVSVVVVGRSWCVISGVVEFAIAVRVNTLSTLSVVQCACVSYALCVC